MRVVGWVLGGMTAGVVAGILAGLLRRQPARTERPAYAGGYQAPEPSVDRTAVAPANLARSSRGG